MESLNFLLVTSIAFQTKILSGFHNIDLS